MTRSRISQIYLWTIIIAGAAVVVFSSAQLSPNQIDVRFLLLAAVTVLIGPRLSIPIPRVKAHISVSDTFIFLCVLLFGGEVAILLATAEAVCMSLRIGRNSRTHLFNASVMACSTFLTVWVVRMLFGTTLQGQDYFSPNYLAILSTMA